MSEKLITIVYDNRLHDEALKSGWGFSCLVEQLGMKILFDTGDNAGRLSFNLNLLGIAPGEIDALVLSHNHHDHTGGLKMILKKNNKLNLFFGRSFPESFKGKLKQREIRFSLISRMLNINKEVYVGPEMESFGPAEVALTIESKRGLVIITGCAHPGIVNMARKIKEILNKEIYLILGGFHLGGSLRLDKIISDLKNLGVKKAGPCHCSGEKAIADFEKNFGENFIKIGAGVKIKLDG